MPELLAIQSDFGASLRDADLSAQAARWLAGDVALAGQRLAIYRANMVAAADKALSAAYPVVRRVVGEEFFHGLARAYQRETPSDSGDLFDFGAGFASFLAAFPHTQSLPYLPDLARLEWAAHRAYGAADSPAWDPSSLGCVAADRQDAIRFRWAAGTAVLASAYPVVRIWTLHQPEHQGEFAVDWSVPERALVAREDLLVTVSALGPGEAAFVAASLAGAALGDAATTALETDPGFDLGPLLARAVGAHLICGFTLEP
jgi:hypothetical protein